MGELGGMHKGLTDEVHAQLKRVDAGDTRIWDFRRQVEEQCRVLCAEAQEKNRIAVSTKSRELGDQHEDTSRKINLQLRRLEAAMEDRAREHRENMERAVGELSTRLEATEEAIHQDETDRTNVLHSTGSRLTDDELWRSSSTANQNDPDVRRHLMQLSQACDSLKADTHGEQGICSRLEEHDVRLTALRSKVESQEKNYREGAAENFYKAFRQLKDHENTLTSHGTRIEELEACWSNLVEEGCRPTVGTVDPPQSPSDNQMGAHERRRVQQQTVEESAPWQGSKEWRAQQQAMEDVAQQGLKERDLTGGQDIYNHATSKALLDAYSRFSTTENTPVLTPSYVDPYDRTTF